MSLVNRIVNFVGLLKKQKQRLTGYVGFLLGICFICFLSHNINIVVSETDSHPKHYFLHLLHVKANLNDYVLLNSDWYGKKIIKQIIGLEGDNLWYDANKCLWINNKKIGLLKSKSRDGRALSPISSQEIPKGYAFVYSDHESSFDSRYQELGLIPISSLRGRVIPLI